MQITDTTETTLRADVDLSILERVPLPDPVELTSAQARKIAGWAQQFAGTCMMDVADIMVGDIRPAAALTTLSDLGPALDRLLRPVVANAMGHGLGLRLMRDEPSSPYELSVSRRVIDEPALHVPYRSLRRFLELVRLVGSEDAAGHSGVDAFAATIDRRARACMDGGYGHYHAYCRRIVDFGRLHDARSIVWGPTHALKRFGTNAD